MDVSVFKKHRNLLICSFVSLFLGAVIFALLFSLDVLDPTYDRWLTVNRFLDLTQGYVGWEFFRKTPWDFPLGMFDGLSYPIKTSIINTDSIPLLAIFFKLLSPILPDTFQYYGMWGILCYMLNSFFGMLLVRKYTNKKYTACHNQFFFFIFKSFC